MWTRSYSYSLLVHTEARLVAGLGDLMQREPRTPVSCFLKRPEFTDAMQDGFCHVTTIGHGERKGSHDAKVLGVTSSANGQSSTQGLNLSFASELPTCLSRVFEV